MRREYPLKGEASTVSRWEKGRWYRFVGTGSVQFVKNHDYLCCRGKDSRFFLVNNFGDCVSTDDLEASVFATV